MATKSDTEENKVTTARNKNLDLAIQQIAKDFGDGAETSRHVIVLLFKDKTNMSHG